MTRIFDDLERFLTAQRPIYAAAVEELRGGSKRSHWMWFVFPQLRGLGRSDMARFYAIRDAGEAEAYLRHPLLGVRLGECAEAVLGWSGRRSAEQIFGAIDALKLCSSMTLFETVADAPPLFGQIIDAFYVGERDPATLRLLAAD